MSDADLDALYASLPTIACQGKCQGACGPTPMSAREFSRLNGATLTPPGFHAQTRTCRYLKHDRCSVYPLRPLICRLYGIVESLRCPEGCEPSRMLTHDEGQALITQMRALSHGAADVFPVTVV